MLWIITVPKTAFKYLVNSILVALATLSSTSSKLMWKRKRHHQQWSNFLHQWWWWWWQRKRRIWCHPRFELLPTKPRTNHQEIKCPKAMFTIHSNLCQCYQLEKKLKMVALKLRNFISSVRHTDHRSKVFQDCKLSYLKWKNKILWISKGNKVFYNSKTSLQSFWCQNPIRKR